MTTTSRLYRHTFGGGLATELGSGLEVSGTEALVEIPYFLRAENIFYQLNGAVRKIGGTSKVNSVALESGAAVRGMIEYVRQGTAGAPTRKRVIAVGTKFKKDDSDGVFTDIFTGVTADSTPCFTVFEDILILSTDGDEAPRQWDQTTASVLGGSPPNFAFSVVHANRLWAAGDRLNPSRLYYSSLLEAEQWNGAGNSGVIDVDPNDGDVITGLYPFRGELIVFKGSAKGSIHRIQGLQPSEFARRRFVEGIGAASQSLIFPLGSDLGFLAFDGSIRTLLASDQFGDFTTSSLSQEIEAIFQMVNFTQIKRAWAAADQTRGYVLLTLPFNASDVPNLTLMMDVRKGKPRFATWNAIEAWSLMRASDPSNSNRLILYAGGNDGYVRKLQQVNRSIDGTGAISAYVRMPFIHYGTSNMMKTIKAVGLGLQPAGDYTASFSLRREAADSQTSIVQATSAVLDSFVLDSDQLAGDQYRTRWIELIDSGQFREGSYEISNVGLDEDLNLQSLHIVLETAQEESYEN